MEILASPYEEGCVSYKEGARRKDNPFDRRTNSAAGPLEAVSWWHGWDNEAHLTGVRLQPNKQ